MGGGGWAGGRGVGRAFISFEKSRQIIRILSVCVKFCIAMIPPLTVALLETLVAALFLFFLLLVLFCFYIYIYNILKGNSKSQLKLSEIIPSLYPSLLIEILNISV